ncbi:hypothetical protein M2337_002467 [Sphingobium sp. B2D3A]|uniref:hypothetical protein n=1 Tax=unclassified Sphingobium TaxID=2611147 RepID=UPI00222439C6|nr:MULTISPECIES: hypothetical protein [unclassified Sphingobium]MCW2338234.1 hypothetical protein [Sphingobium sp. B2D3A]MCW2384692.1 hypothetical protein [Sphingobium sp. B2D3D]
MAVYKILTRDGVADPGQEQMLLDIAGELQKPGARLLLHLHGGLVDEASGLSGATRLSGGGPNSWQLPAENPAWTELYVIWRTGAFETIKTNWTDLVHDDRLYQTVLKKLIGFVARKLGVPAIAARGPGSLAIDEDEILRRVKGHGDTARPFVEIDELMAPTQPVGARATLMGEQTNGDLAMEFEGELAEDPDFQQSAADIDEAINVPSGARAPSVGADMGEGAKMLDRLDTGIQAKLAPPVAVAGAPRGIVSAGVFLLSHAGQIAIRCFKRFKSGRDHGLHATIVEEVCRELYGDLVGAKVWGMMVQDAADHFGSGKLGSALVDIVKAHPPQDFVITGHSAGSIWASRFLLAAKAAGVTKPVRLFLLAPAVRQDLFADMISKAGDLIERCRMITMTDELERRDAVLGHDKGYIYPSSLLYVVSGMFEEMNAKAYPDAPILGMQRFATVSGFDPQEQSTAKAIAAFFQAPDHGIISSPTAGVSVADAHGDFDNEPLTLATARALF